MGQIMTDLEKYLRNASLGTYGKTRALIRNELEANIRMRGKELEHHGLNETQTIARALEELGEANLVNAGMTGVYTMPKLTRTALPIAFALTAAVVYWGISRAQVETTSIGTIPECDFATIHAATSNFVPCVLEGNWFKLSSFKSELEHAGGMFDETPKSFNLHFPKDQTIEIPTDGSDFGTVRFNRDGETFFETTAVINAVAQKSNLPVKLEGYINPRLTVGDTPIEFGTNSTPVKTTWLRFMNLQTQLREDFQKSGFRLEKIDSPNFNLEFRRIATCCGPLPKIYAKVNEPAGTIYAAIQQHYDYKFLIDIAEVNTDGKLEFALGSSTAYFVNDFKKFKPGQGETILLRLTNRIDARAKQYEIAPLPANLIGTGK